MVRARTVAQLGFVGLTFDLRGHGESSRELGWVTPEHNLSDVAAAYDALAAQPHVDRSSIAVVASSYGAYLATIITGLRPVRWLALRVPALYRDADWTTRKAELDRGDLARYRGSLVSPANNRALKSCSEFEGDVLIVASEHDDYVPHTTVASYLSAFVKAKSVTYRVVTGADHALSSEESRQAYNQLLSLWLREMIFGAR